MINTSKPLVWHIFRLHVYHLSILYSDSVVVTKGSVRGWSKGHFFMKIKHIIYGLSSSLLLFQTISVSVTIYYVLNFHEISVRLQTSVGQNNSLYPGRLIQNLKISKIFFRILGHFLVLFHLPMSVFLGVD